MSEELSQGPGTWQVFDSPLSYCDACVHSYMHQGFELNALGHCWLYALLGLVFWPAHSTYIRAFSLWTRLSLGSQASMFIIDPEPEIEHVLWKLESHWISWTSLWFWRLQLLIVCGLLVCRSIGVFAEIEAFEWPNCLEQIIHMPIRQWGNRRIWGPNLSWQVPWMQQTIINICHCLNRPVIVASQLLDSRIQYPTHTHSCWGSTFCPAEGSSQVSYEQYC